MTYAEIKTTFIEEPLAEVYNEYGGGFTGIGAYYYMSQVTPEITVEVPVQHEQIPPGETAARRGTRVEETDGYPASDRVSSRLRAAHALGTAVRAGMRRELC
jgi:hypothetical protein